MQYARKVAKTAVKSIFVQVIRSFSLTSWRADKTILWQVGAYMTHLYSIKPVVNPRDGVVEFINVGVDDKTYCVYRHSFI